MNRRCVICGARVRNINHKVNTCDSICTNAKHNGLTREEQILQDIERQKKLEHDKDNYFRGLRIDWL